MKIWTNYCKEMKIASRGFYFYMEIILAVISLLALLLLVPEKPKPALKEVIFFDMSAQEKYRVLGSKVAGSYLEKVEDTAIKLKPATITWYEEDTGKKIIREYEDKKTILLETYLYHDGTKGEVTKINYAADSFDIMMRVINEKKFIGSVMWYGEDGKDYYKATLTGSETERYKNLIRSIHGNVDALNLFETIQTQKVRYLQPQEQLTKRQQYIPLIVVFMNAMMGIMIIIAYIAIDKGEGLIKAFSVAPQSIDSYLLSKILVIMTTTIISSIVISIPIMKLQPNYLLLLLSLITLTFLSCTIGLVVASFFSDLKSSFGVLIILMLLFMLPIFSFIIPSFSPLWVKFFPTYYMIEAVKECLLQNRDTAYILITNAGMAIAGLIFFAISKKRYKNVLGL